MQMKILILAGDLLFTSVIAAELIPAISTDNAHYF
jgi:hypothetical protein